MRKNLVFLMLLLCAYFASSQRSEPVRSLEDLPLINSKEIPSTPFLIEVNGQTTKHDLISQGYSIIRQISSHRFIVRAQQPTTYYPSAWIDPDWKISLEARQSKGNNRYLIKASDFSKFDHDPNIDIHFTKFDLIAVTTSAQYIREVVSQWEEVVYITLQGSPPHTEGNVLDLNLNPNKVNAVHHYYPGLTGEGFNVSIQEQRFFENDLDLLGRTVFNELSSDDEDKHATDMATICAGAGNSFVTGKGVATRATLYSSDFADILPDEDADYQMLETWVQNHSYGKGIQNYYGLEAQAFDRSVINNPQLVHVFSSGNSGGDTSTEGPYANVPGYANLTGNFKMSKNTLCVGSADTTGRPYPLASIGPAYDGRVKPEVVSYSTDGSSNSAALVSGIALLMQQQYQNLHGEIPHADYIKAVLINSADDVYNDHVDFATGFGNVNALRAIEAIGKERHLSAAIQHDEVVTFPLNLPGNVEQLKITLVWTDTLAGVASSQALVNDLDMKLVKDEATILPWVLDASPAVPSLAAEAVRGEDHLNNVEQITVKNPQAGDYEIQVHGYDVSTKSQEFVVVYDWELTDTFRWTNPTGSDNFPYNGETGTYFRWESTLSETSGSLEYSVDGGLNWEKIADVDLSLGHHRWVAPDIFARAQARMVVGSEIYLTEEFSISQPVRISVGFNCDDSVMLLWEGRDEVTDYDVLHLGDSFLSQVTNLTDSFLVIEKSAFNTQYFAIKPYINGKPMINSLTFDYERQGVGCFVATFFSNPHKEGVTLQLQMGTTYGVSAVRFERLNNNQFGLISRVIPDSAIVVSEDLDPYEGLNEYRAVIELINGQEIITDPSQSYFLSDVPFLVFPNPVSTTDYLTIFAKDLDGDVAKFYLYGTDGKLALEKTLNAEVDIIDLQGLYRGVYLYVIRSKNYFSTARIIVR